MKIIELDKIYHGIAKIDLLPEYIERAKRLADIGEQVTITGPAPVWLYLSIAHALHGKAISLFYESPASGPVLIFDHNPR